MQNSPTNNPLLDIHPEVGAAIDDHHPVVALESTIITHGMPYPANVETAFGVEEQVRKQGAIPATIAVMNGKIKVGLNHTDLEKLADTPQVRKLSRADIAYSLAMGETGSTTVAATMIAAHLAGINVFATGGIGGVHVDGQNSMDISADLTELAKTPIMVVSAGPKAILDIERTLEYLETLGVSVVTVGSDTMPAFWSSSSPFPTPLKVDNETQIANIWQTRQTLGQTGGMLIANPVPDHAAIDYDTMAQLIDDALSLANAEGVRGKAVTPWLLAKIVDLSHGQSLSTNKSLIFNNAAFAGKLAVACSLNS